MKHLSIHFLGTPDEKNRLYTCLAIMAVIFLIAFIFGIATTFFAPEFTQTILAIAGAQFAGVEELSNFQLFGFIFFHNLQIAAVLFLLGLLFGAVPVILIFANGFVIGLIGALFAQYEGVVPTIAALFPHGILELPAILLAASLGLVLGGTLFTKIFTKNSPSLRRTFVFGAINFAYFVIPLLFLAALVETYVSAEILNQFIPRVNV